MTMPELQGRLDRAARRHETACGDGHMVWREWGAGRTVLLLHGSFGAWTHWLRNIEALSTHFRVLACDLPGMGESDLPPMPFDAGSLADILVEGLERLAPEPFHLVGFSFGGIVGGHVAVRTMPRVMSYTAIGSNALGLPMATRAPLRKPNRNMSEAEILDLHRHNLGLQMFGDPARIDATALAVQNANTRRARIRSGKIPAGDSLARRLREMSAAGLPVQGIWGERDATAGDLLHTRRDLFHALRPDCPFHVIPGAGHWAAFEAPDEVNRILIDSLPAMETPRACH